MNKNRKERKLLFLLFMILGMVILFLTRGKYLYGSVTDWATQHYRIPEYFRNLFYETHDLFPDFAFHLGAGQNIYYLSYYGLFSPVILLSYLFPFISMQSYIIGSTILLFFLSILLFYHWIHKRYSGGLSFILTFIFAFSTPLLFHSHRHIMFMNYMPFLLMSFIGIDNYFEKQKNKCLLFGTFFMIMTSYFFSVSGIVAIIIYGIYKYMETTNKRTIKSYLMDGFKFVILIVIAICMAGILLLPTLYTILEGRVEGSSIAISSLLIPNFRLTDILYGGYAFGLTSILFLGIIYNYDTKKIENRFLAICLTILISFPISLYILNGGMYVNGKVLIPFLPLAILCIANVLKTDKIDKKYIYIYGILSILILFLNRTSSIVWLFTIDVFVTLIGIYLLNKKQKKKIFYALLMMIVFVSSIYANMNDILLKKESIQYQEAVKYIEEQPTVYRTNNLYNHLHSINQVLSPAVYTTSIYSSTSNSNYKDFYKNDINNEFTYRSREILSTTYNLLSNIYLGNKYVISDGYNQVGYKKVQDQIPNVYQNDNVFSIGYVTRNIMSKREYDSLPYPYNIDAIMHYTIVDTEIENVYQKRIEPITLDVSSLKDEVQIVQTNNKYIISSLENGSNLTLKINNVNDLKGKILLLQFTIFNTSNLDRSIIINGIENKLTKNGWKYHNENYTFEYTLGENDIDTLDIIFSKGIFEIIDVTCYAMDSDEVLSIQNDMHDEFIIDKVKTKGDVIEGTVQVKEHGYFSISIPYDTGFTIYVDGKKTLYERVNNNFIGFEIEKGEHTIRLEYHSPYKNVGIIVSLIGCVFCLLALRYSKNICTLSTK